MAKKPFFILLSTLFISACRLLSGTGDQAKTSSTLPTGDPTIFYQPALASNGLSPAEMNLYALQGETAVRWQPSSGDLNIWELSPSEYRFVVQQQGSENQIVFLGANGRFRTYTIGKQQPAHLSPDGRYVHQLSNKQLNIRRVDQVEWTPITHNAHRGPVWAGDGAYLLYTSQSPNQLTVYHVATGQSTLVLETEGTIRQSVWSPDNSKFAVMVVNPDEQATLYEYTADGQTQLTAKPLAVSELSQWRYMPNGRSILALGGQNSFINIYQLTEDTIISHIEPEGSIRDVHVSPDGAWVIFDVDNWRQADSILLTRLSTVNGTATLNAIEAPQNRILQAKFSPDGNKVALIIGYSNMARGLDALWVLDLTTPSSQPQQLLPKNQPTDSTGAYAGVSSFVWSADSQSLYVTASLEGSCESKRTFSAPLVPKFSTETSCRFSLYQIGADGSALTQLSDFQTPLTQQPRANMFWLP